jgi:hypothetical protein
LMLKIEPRALSMLHICSTTQLQPQFWTFYWDFQTPFLSKTLLDSVSVNFLESSRSVLLCLFLPLKHWNHWLLSHYRMLQASTTPHDWQLQLPIYIAKTFLKIGFPVHFPSRLLAALEE